MGFLLTSYNSLPEQVEANKEKCKDLQNQIDNIDTHEIEEVKDQVQTNTQNIANVTQGLGVTNTALNAVTQDVNDLKPRVTNLETKTSNMSKSGVDTAFTESINVAKSINAGTNINADGLITAGNDIISVGGVIKGEVLVADNDQGEGRFAIDDDGDMSLYNPANAGKLITTGNIEQYAPQTKLYEHNINMHLESSTYNYGHLNIKIINKVNTAFTLASLKQWLNDNGFTTKNKSYLASGSSGTTGEFFTVYTGVYFSNGDTSLRVTGQRATSPSIQPSNFTYDSIYTFTDTIREI